MNQSLASRTTAENRPSRPEASSVTEGDDGFSLIELLVIIGILGVLATVVVMAVVGGVRAEASSASCAGEQRQLITASEAYFAQTRTDSIPATGTGNDRFEQTLVDFRLLRSVSTLFDVDADGELTAQAGSSC